ncbi:MAG: hypothetical protein M3Z84_01845 [Actinomycetota bacterium]|nr:hypothetical protein [Actinomycetota bacterium]
MPAQLAGTFVVVVAESDGAPKTARLAEGLRERGARVAVFASDGDLGDVDAVVELMGELGGGVE